jgi:hypothetical protein
MCAGDGMSVSLRLDTREFQAAMREYVEATGKDSAEALNRQGRNFAIKCIQKTKQPRGAAAIRALAEEPWWPKLVSKVMGQAAGGGSASKMFQAQWAAAERAKRLKAGGHKGSFKLDREEQSYARAARQMSRKILSSRTAAISFLRFFFRVLAGRMSQHSKGSGIPGGKQFAGFNSSVSAARPKQLTVGLMASYGYRKRGGSTAAGTERLLQDAMTQALSATVADMREYVATKLARRAQEKSGRKS